MRIKVLTRHIRKGIRGSNCSCPIALALNEAYKTTDIRVMFSWAHIGDLIIDLPRKAVKFIKDFDKKKSSVKPFEFEL
jgi:hypothetical protein